MNSSRTLCNSLSGLAALSAGILLSVETARAATEPARNLALSARASAFETYQGMEAKLAIDGHSETRWSGIPGHNTGGWFELEWEQPVQIGEVVVFQHDRYVKEMDVQVWDTETRAWVTIEHFGRADARLPRIVVCRLKPKTTTRLRLANITNGPSFNEIQVFENTLAHPPALSLASDANGNFIGMVSDEWGSAQIAGAEVSLSGEAAGGAWQVSTRSDRHGLFTAPMPLGLRGEVTGSVRLAEAGQAQPASTRADAAGFQYGLTPENLRRSNADLSGTWRFAPDPPADFWKPEFSDSQWATIAVPAHFAMEGFRSVDGIGGYRKSFRVPGGEGRVKLLFEGVYSGAEVWVNGHRLAYHEGGALPFEVDITEVARSEDNLVAVRVTQHTAVSDRLDKMSEYADFPLAGIMRPVRLFRTPALHIGALEISTKFDAGFGTATLTGLASLLNESPEAVSNVAVKVQLLDPEGKEARVSAKLPGSRIAGWQRSDLEFSLEVPAPRAWEAEHPNLYTLVLTLSAGDRTSEELAQRIGFRQTDIRDRQLLINGRPVKIRGTCHHDSHPTMGRAVTAELTRRDLELMKEANLNSLRTSHYPPRRELLEIADELGIYVEDEGSFCWVEASDDLRLTPRIMQLNAELLARDRNHPSVFIWSVCNESSFGFGFERSHEWMRNADPSRPHAGSWERGSLDIQARHNPIAIGDIEELEKSRKPVLWDESWCIYQGIFGDIGEMWVDPGVRDYYGEPLAAIYARMMRSHNVMGSQIWAWSDDIFCVPNRGLEYGRQSTPCHFIENQYRLPNRGLVGDAPWGVVDGWRRKKPEFWITRKLHSPIKVKEGPLPLPEDGRTIRVEMENQYDFTDLSELRVEWQLGKRQGVARGSAAPHTKGTLAITAPQPIEEGDLLGLRFIDARGQEVDAYNLTIGKSKVAPPTLRAPGSQPLRMRQETLLAGQGTRVIGDDFELSFDHSTGRLRRGVAFGQALLLDIPELHILPTATPMSRLPNHRSWRLRNLEVKPESNNVRVRIEGSYDKFEGSYNLLVTPTGEITARGSFKYSGEKILARETGLAFALPKECDLLEWRRRGDWSAYPSDHIGRTAGETRAFARHTDTLPPTWPWAEDNSPMGCNDFRSTKRHIEWAAIRYPSGPGLWVFSDGAAHIRAMVESDRIVFHVNDWYGGTHAGQWEWTSNYGEGKAINPGQTIEGSAQFRLARPQERF